jgi:hypothetical protein
LLLVVAFGAILAVTMEVFLPKEGQWSGMESHHCDEFCENNDKCDHTMDERPTIQQPVNAYSNIVYIWCGIIPLVFFRVDVSTMMYFCSSVLLGVSSFMYHASITRMWMNMDSANMYTYITALVFQGLNAVFGISWHCLAPILAILIIAMPFLRPLIPPSIQSAQVNLGQGLIITGLSMVLVLAKIYKILNHAAAKTRVKYQAFAVVCTALFQIFKVIGVAVVPALFCAIATIGWMNDREKSWCNPDSVFQWHGIWVSGGK